MTTEETKEIRDELHSLDTRISVLEERSRNVGTLLWWILGIVSASGILANAQLYVRR